MPHCHYPNIYEVFQFQKISSACFLLRGMYGFLCLTCSLSLSLFYNWQAVAEKLQILKQKLGEEDHSALREIRETVLQMKAPNQLVCYFCS